MPELMRQFMDFDGHRVDASVDSLVVASVDASDDAAGMQQWMQELWD